MAKHKYSRRRQEEGSDDYIADDFPDDPDDADEVDEVDDETPESAPQPRRGRRTAAARTARAPVEWPGASGSPGALRSTQMQDQEPIIAYAVAALLAVVSIVLVALTTSPIDLGRDKHGHEQIVNASPTAPLVGLALALVMAASVRRFNHRIVAGVLGMLSAFALSVAASPQSLRALQTFVFLVPLGFALWMTFRQSRTQRAIRAVQVADRAAERRTARGAASPRPAPRATGRARGAKKAEEPAGPRRNARYTPPKPRPEDDDRRGRRSRG